MSAAPSIEIDVNASIGVVRPGDKLVIGLAQPVTADQVKDWQAYIAGHLPGVEAVVVCAHTLAVYHPDYGQGEAAGT